MDTTFFVLLGACVLALGTAAGVVLARRPIYSAIALLGHTLSLAGLFAVLGAGFVAVGQIVIYSGAIVVLFLIVVTLLPRAGTPPIPGSALAGDRASGAIIGGGALAAALAVALSNAQVPVRSGAAMGDVEAIGLTLFGSQLVAFELTAPLLLVAIIGAVAIWQRHEPRADERTRKNRVATRPDRKMTLHR